MRLKAIALGLAVGMMLCPMAGRSQAMDFHGAKVDPVAESKGAVTVLIFVRTDCPISNRYAPEIERIHEEFRGRGVRFWIVYPGNSGVEAEKHFAEYGYAKQGEDSIGGLIDPSHELVKRSQVVVTPEAAVFAGGRLEYHGRIDDRFVDFGRGRTRASRHDLEMVLNAVLAGKPAPERTARAAGCYISDLK